MSEWGYMSSKKEYHSMRAHMHIYSDIVYLIRMESTPSAVHVQRVMRETTVSPTPMAVIPILVKMEELVR